MLNVNKINDEFFIPKGSQRIDGWNMQIFIIMDVLVWYGWIGFHIKIAQFCATNILWITPVDYQWPSESQHKIWTARSAIDNNFDRNFIQKKISFCHSLFQSRALDKRMSSAPPIQSLFLWRTISNGFFSCFIFEFFGRIHFSSKFTCCASHRYWNGCTIQSNNNNSKPKLAELIDS